jgi:quercetin dioxygenase-like cupin family protein/quinol monooxygenase YgiN
MYGAFFKIVAKPGKRGELVEFLRWDAAVAKAAEPDTMRFDVWDVPGEPDALYVYEAYRDPAGFAKHQANKPYQRYVNHIDPELLEPERRIDVFGFNDSVISNDDLVWQADSSRVVTQTANPDIARLSFMSFPPDAEALPNFSQYGELRRLTSRRNSSAAHVHFPPGVRTHWHRHGGEQLLWFIEGEGTVALRDGRSLTCRAGDIVRVSAHSSHWHGASAEHFAIHIAITEGITTWEERVADSG